MTQESSKETSKEAYALWREVGFVYLVVFFAVLALAILSMSVGVIAVNLYALVAAVFIGVPYFWMQRKGLDAEEYGVTWVRWKRSALWGVLFTAVTVPVFLVGQYAFEVILRDQPLHLEAEHYWRWPLELEGEPKVWGGESGVWVWSRKRKLYVGIRGTTRKPGKVLLQGDGLFRPKSKGTGVLIRAVDEKGDLVSADAQGLAKRWELLPTMHHRRVMATVDTVDSDGRFAPRNLTIKVAWATKKNVEDRSLRGLHLGADAHMSEGELKISRGLLWMFLWAITHVFFIALPEEYFYRGYLQTRVKQAFAASRKDGEQSRSVMGFTLAIFMTSVLFGIGHLLIPVEGVLLVQRFSVFFPALLFGWLRRHTGSIVGAVLYHAACNLMVIYMGIHYG